MIILSVALMGAAKKPRPTRPQDAQALQSAREILKAGDPQGSAKAAQKILESNPDDVDALSVLAGAQAALSDKAAVKTLERAAQYESPIRPSLYYRLALAHRANRAFKKAEQAFKAALALDPQNYVLHFELGLNAWDLDNASLTIRSLQQAIRLSPNFAAAHAALGDVYMDEGQAIPALLAYARHLVLEPVSPHSGGVLEDIQKILEVRQANSTVVVTYLRLSGGGPTDQGDFRAAETNLGIAMGVRYGNVSDPDARVRLGFQQLLGLLVEETSLGKGFAAEFYGPYFKQIQLRQHTNAFLDHAFQKLRTPDTPAPTRAEADAFQQWSEAYAWPR